MHAQVGFCCSHVAPGAQYSIYSCPQPTTFCKTPDSPSGCTLQEVLPNLLSHGAAAPTCSVAPRGGAARCRPSPTLAPWPPPSAAWAASCAPSSRRWTRCCRCSCCAKPCDGTCRTCRCVVTVQNSPWRFSSAPLCTKRVAYQPLQSAQLTEPIDAFLLACAARLTVASMPRLPPACTALLCLIAHIQVMPYN